MVSQLGKRKRLKRVLCWYIYFISVWRRLLLAGVWKLLVHWKRPTFFGRSVEAAGAVEGVHCQADLPQYHPLPPRLHLPQVQPFTRNIVSTDKLFKGSVSQDYRWLFIPYLQRLWFWPRGVHDFWFLGVIYTAEFELEPRKNNILKSRDTLPLTRSRILVQIVP